MKMVDRISILLACIVLAFTCVDAAVALAHGEHPVDNCKVCMERSWN